MAYYFHVPRGLLKKAFELLLSALREPLEGIEVEKDVVRSEARLRKQDVYLFRWKELKRRMFEGAAGRDVVELDPSVDVEELERIRKRYYNRSNGFWIPERELDLEEGEVWKGKVELRERASRSSPIPP